MTPESVAHAPSAHGRSTRSWRERWFAGLTWKGLALVALLCAINAFRRTFESVLEEPFALDVWLLDLGAAFATSLVVLMPVTLAIVAAYNAAPAAPRWRYPALAFALLISSGIGTAILGALESPGQLAFFHKISGPLDWSILTIWFRNTVLGLLIAALFVYLRLAEDAEAATHRAELDRARFGQQLDE